MAKNLKFTRNIVDKMTIKGVLDKLCQTITFVDENDQEQTIKVADCLAPFADKSIDFSISIKTEEDLTQVKGQ